MSEKNHPNLITIIPECINISHFIPGKIYKPFFTIYNTCNIPIILNLRSSDRNKIILNDNLIRLEVNQSKKINLIIQDNINYSSGKIPSKKKLYISLKGEFIEEKYDINLIYFTNDTEQSLDNESNIEGLSNLASEYLKHGNTEFNDNSNKNKNIDNENKNEREVNIKNNKISFESNTPINSSKNMISFNSQFENNKKNNDLKKNDNNNINKNNNNNLNYNNNNNSINNFNINNNFTNKNFFENNLVIQKNNTFQIIGRKSNLEILNIKAKTLLEKMQIMSNLLQEFEKISDMKKDRYDSKYLLKSSLSIYSIGKNYFEKQFQEKKKEIEKNTKSLEKMCLLTKNRLLLSEKEELNQRYKILESKVNEYKLNKKNQTIENNEEKLISNKISSNISPKNSEESS